MDTNHIVTVDGRIEPEELGVTLPHEHIFVDQVTSWFEQPEEPRKQRLAEEPVTLETLEYVRTHPLTNKDNMRLDSTETAIDELSSYYNAGGDTVVDLSPKGIGADPDQVYRIARATGLNIVHGTAYYTKQTHPDHVTDSSISEIETEFVNDIQNGIDDTNVRAGIIGEIGLSDTIHEDEEKVLRAGARAALRTGAPLNIHPPLFGPKQTPRAAMMGLDIIEEEGLPLNRVIVSHMDQDHEAMKDLTDYKQIANRGAYLEFDQWYAWTGYLAEMDKVYPSDATRVEAIFEMIEDGYLDQLLISHDICTKMQLTKYGGKGYVYVHDVLRPWMRSRGLSEKQWHAIMEENPRQAFTFVELQ